MKHIAAAAALGSVLLAREAHAQLLSEGSSLDRLAAAGVVVLAVIPNVILIGPNAEQLRLRQRSTGLGGASVAVGTLSLLGGVLLLASEGDALVTMGVVLSSFSAINMGLGLANLSLPERTDRPRVMLFPAVLPASEGVGYGLTLRVISM
ncbi:MAG: hypothetical protein U0325_33675 [Polyangiales bacterium]